MKIRIALTIDYDDPENKESYNELLAEIEKWIFDRVIPQTENIWCRTISIQELKSDYCGENNETI